MYEQGIIHPPTTFQGILILPVLSCLTDDKAVRSIMGITQETIRILATIGTQEVGERSNVIFVRIETVEEIFLGLQEMINCLTHELASEVIEGLTCADVFRCLEMQGCLVIVNE